MVDNLLSRLDGVRATGRGRWIARCPAHADRHPSLSVRVLDNGWLVLKCHAQCATLDVLTAIGLEWDALFPDKLEGHAVKGERRPFPASDVLRVIGFEALVVAVAAGTLAAGATLTDEDRARLRVAAGRLQEGARAFG